MEEEKAVEGMVSNRDSTIAATICVLLASVLTWALLGGPFQNVIVDNGSVADWIAAGGTWVIGFLAWKIQRDSQAHHAKQVRNEEDRQRLRRVSILSGMVVRVKLAEVEVLTFRSRFETFSADRWDLTSAELAFSLSNAALERQQWTTEERMMLSSEALYTLEKMERFILKAKIKSGTIALVYPERKTGDPKSFTKVATKLMKGYEGELATVSRFAVELKELIIQQIELEGGDTARHRAPALDEW